MIMNFKSALDKVKADKSLEEKTKLYLQNKLIDNNNFILKNRSDKIMKRNVLAACMAFIFLLGGGGVYAYYKTPQSYISLDINPSVELGINAFGTVVEANACNEDGTKILSGVDVEGSNVTEAVNTLVKSASDNGFVLEDGSTVISVTSETDNDELAEKLEEDAEDGAQEALEDEDKEADINKDNVKLNLRENAEEYGISAGKLNLINKLMKVDPNATVEQYKNASVKEIMKRIKSLRANATKSQDKSLINDQENPTTDTNQYNDEDSDKNEDITTPDKEGTTTAPNAETNTIKSNETITKNSKTGPEKQNVNIVKNTKSNKKIIKK